MLPGVKIAAVADMASVLFHGTSWNDQVSVLASDIDAVTLHDYSLRASDIAHMSADDQVQRVTCSCYIKL